MPKLIRCPNGHFYDFERTGRCPYCTGQSAEDVPPPGPPDCPGEEEFMRRLAEREAAERERGATAEVPPVEERADKTVPLDGGGADRTAPPVDLDRRYHQLKQMCGWAIVPFVISLALAIFNVIDSAIPMTAGSGAVLVCGILCVRTRGKVPPAPVSVLAALFCVLSALASTDWFWWTLQVRGPRRLLTELLRMTDWHLYALLGAVSCIVIPPLALIAIFRYQKAARNTRFH